MTDCGDAAVSEIPTPTNRDSKLWFHFCGNYLKNNINILCSDIDKIKS